MTFTSDISLGAVISFGSIVVSGIILVWRLAGYNNNSDNRYHANVRRIDQECLDRKRDVLEEKAARAKLEGIVTRMDAEGGTATRTRFSEQEKEIARLTERISSVEGKIGPIADMAADIKQVRKDVDEILKLFPRQPGVSMPQ
jgi:hypothetical protein